MKDKIQELKEIFSKELPEIGYELVDIEMANENKEKHLVFYIYKENMNVNDCETASRYLDPRLDEIDPFDFPYYLEVSSPDLNRPLITDRDLERNLGKRIDLFFYKKIDGSKTARGKLEGFDKETIQINDGKKTMSFERSDISKIKIVVI